MSEKNRMDYEGDNNMSSDASQQEEGIVRISEDRMTATIELPEPEPGQEYTVEMIVGMLNENDVREGIFEEAIQQMLRDKVYHTETEVAFGKPPKHGEDGYFIYHFNTNPRSAPEVLEDGSVDYRNLQCFESVTKDQMIAEYVRETKGVDGYDVTGKPIPAQKGKPKPAIRGKHIYMSEDKRYFYSDVDGKISFDDSIGKITISNSWTITGDVDASTGNISFKGDVEVMGSILAGYKVEVTGSLVVSGIVEAATLLVGKDVMLKSGMSGNGKGIIVAGGNVEGRFFEQANIECGGYVYANSIMNCYIDSKDMVVLSGNRGVLLAGRVYALRGVEAVNIGNEAQVHTYIKVGMEPKMRKRYEELRKEIDLAERDIEKLSKIQQSLSVARIAPEQKSEMEKKKVQITRTKIQKSTELEKLRDESKDLEAQIEAGKQAAVVVDEWAHAGCSITINGATNNIKEDIKGIVFSLRKGNVVMNYKE